MRQILLAVLAFFIATGFTACEKKCDPITVVQEVKIPVPVKCKMTLPVAPISPISNIQLGDTYYLKAMALMKENEQYRRYSEELEAAATACIESPLVP